jgi:Bifunctional DNA primase/polymerase, N-terminal
MTDLHDAALEYQKRRLPIFPLQPRGKEPACARGCLDATTDIDRVRGWWGQVKELNIGLATGARSGLFVVDVDAEDGRQSLTQLEEKHDKLPATVSVVTGRDGRGEHLYFKLNGHSVRNSPGLIGRGLDVRGDGGYVLLPPSIHPSGRVYAWNIDSADDFAVAPDWLHSIIDSKPRNGNGDNGNGYRQTMNFWDDFLGQDRPEGERNNAVIKVTGKFFHAGLRDPFLLFHAVNFYNTGHCRPPLSAQEIFNAVNYCVQSQLKKERDGDGREIE